MSKRVANKREPSTNERLLGPALVICAVAIVLFFAAKAYIYVFCVGIIEVVLIFALGDGLVDDDGECVIVLAMMTGFVCLFGFCACIDARSMARYGPWNEFGAYMNLTQQDLWSQLNDFGSIIETRTIFEGNPYERYRSHNITMVLISKTKNLWFKLEDTPRMCYYLNQLATKLHQNQTMLHARVLNLKNVVDCRRVGSV